MNTVVVPAVKCCFWPLTARCLGSCEMEHYRDVGSKTYFCTFLAFLLRLLRSNLAGFLYKHAGWLFDLATGTGSE